MSEKISSVVSFFGKEHGALDLATGAETPGAARNRIHGQMAHARRTKSLKSLDGYASSMHIDAYAIDIDYRRRPDQEGREAHRRFGKNGTGAHGAECSYCQGKRAPPC